MKRVEERPPNRNKMTKDQKNEVIEVLKGKFSQYDNFYITDTESLSVSQITKLRRACFDKNVEMKVAKNTLIKKALMFSENPKEPAVILSSFRKDSKAEKPELKLAFINGDVYAGDNNLKALTQIKTKNELIGDVIGLLLSPIQRVIGALQNRPEADLAPVAAEAAPATEATTEAPVTETPAAEAAPEVPVTEAPVTEAPAAEAAPETPAAEEKPSAE